MHTAHRLHTCAECYPSAVDGAVDRVTQTLTPAAVLTTCSAQLMLCFFALSLSMQFNGGGGGKADKDPRAGIELYARAA
ncbi:hypothetical protein E2562_037921 [Oryza meyeriana var. granulata]|uniref:Uncharacterized protein n=1 Tax=Oryza meyeriana var. granulata TaxID=110450 RepID=A0A6G1E8F8_9ORYZ|nr:hypothetical protein E2562_037921 [Oryza meyeriana var. granulata]